MPVYNGAAYLREAIQSVLAQTERDFELIIINDGSIDDSASIIGNFTDPRIIYLDNGRNLGLAASFNAGIERASGEYLARMDADDICLPERFAKQLSFLAMHPEIGVIGSSITIIDEAGRPLALHKRPLTHKGIKFASLFSTPLYHPTVMGRTEIFKRNRFNETFSNSEDYELWSRLLFTTEVKFANLKEPLLNYRVYPQSFTQTLNLDRRALSAHNTIKNVEHYVSLSARDKNTLIHLRQELFLGIPELAAGLFLYARATLSFISREKPSLGEMWDILKRYVMFVVSLGKHDLKKILIHS